MEATERIEPRALDAKQAACYVNISLRKLDELQAAGELRPIRIGRKRLFLREQLDALLKRAATQQVG
ncbi:MAG: excisionase family DNA-binding protein [Rhodothermales bacterium]